jgi:AcrR family transcriptional regulator
MYHISIYVERQISHWDCNRMPAKADPEERRAHIVQAAFRCIARAGLEQFSMRTVAKEAGCTIGMVNHWFASKNDLVEATWNVAAEAALQRTNEALSAANVEDAFASALPLDDVRTAELKVWLAFWALAISQPGLREQYGSRNHRTRSFSKKEMRARGLDLKQAEAYTNHIMAMIDGITVNALLDPDYWTPQRQVKSLRWMLNAMAEESAVGT